MGKNRNSGKYDKNYYALFTVLDVKETFNKYKIAKELKEE